MKTATALVIALIAQLSHAQTSSPSPFSLGSIASLAGSSGHHPALRFDAVAFAELSNLSDRGKPTFFYWAAFAGSSTAPAGRAVAGSGVEYVRAIGDKGRWSLFLGVVIQGQTAVSPALGGEIGFRF